MNNKKVKITEAQIQSIVKKCLKESIGKNNEGFHAGRDLNESKKRKLFNALMEISYGKVDDTVRKADNIVDDLKTRFDDFYDTFNEINIDVKNGYMAQIRKHADAIYNILDRKDKQVRRMYKDVDNIDHKAYYNDNDAAHPDGDYPDIEDVQIRDLRQKYGN